MAQVPANKGKLCLLRINIFDLTYPVYRFMLHNIATQAIDRIGWIYDHPPVFQAFRQLFDQPGLGVIGMYMN